MATNTDEREEIKPVAPTEQTKWRDPSLVGKYMVDPKTGLAGLFRSPDNGETWVLTDTVYGHVYNQDEVDNIWDNGAGHKVADEIKSATADLPNVRKQADEAVKFAESAIAVSKVNSDAIVAQSSAVVEAKSAMDSATAEIQQLKANAASDVAQIRADVAQVQNEVDTAKAANSASVDKLKSDIGLAQKDLDNVRDSLTKAQSAVEQNQKLINDSVAKINNDIAQNRQDIVTAQQANDDLAKQLDTYSKEAQEQGKTIKTIQDNQDGFSITIADVKGAVTKVSDTVDGLSAGLKDAQGNIASVKAQADQLNATLTDHSKNIAQLTATAKELSSTLEDADGRLSKVEQTASEQSTTLSDLQGNLTQVEQTADNLVTTLKDAQGNIDQIKQDAKGTLEQLSNAQGDITALQKDVSGIKLTIADHDKNIHTLQADSKTLKDDMADAKGNISSLQKTSTSLVSEFKDHDGRLSKVEQTASTLTNEFSDQQGHLNRVEQTAQGTQQTVANQQGQINTIKTDASGIHETLTGQGNQIATINVTLNSLKSQYEGVSGDLNKLKNGNQWKTVTGDFNANQYTQTARIFYQDTKAKNTPDPGWFYFIVEAPVDGRVTQNLIKDNSDDSWNRFYDGEWSAWTKGVTNLDVTSLSDRVTTNSTQITQNKKEIDLKASQDTVDNLTGEVSQTKAQLKVQADQISSKVSSEDFKTLDNKVGGAIAQIDKNTTAIDQTNKEISLKADQTEVDKVKGTASQNSSRIDVMANEIKQKVDGTTVNNILDSKGYATMSYAQTLVKQTKDQWNVTATNLDTEIKDKDGVNLQQGTGDCSLQINGNGTQVTKEKFDDHTNMIHTVGNTSGCYISYGSGDFNFIPEAGKTYTFSCDIKGQGQINGSGFKYEGGDNGTMGTVTLSNNWVRISNTVHVNTISGAWVIYPTPINGKVDFYVKHIKIERGSIATPWTPAPSDNASITQISNLQVSIDGIQGNVTNLKSDTSSKLTQLSNTFQSKIGDAQIAINDLKDKTLWKSTDSVDLNNVVTQQKIFVKGGSNLPPGTYWWYVQVEPGYGGRIVQYAVSDRDNKHFSRQYDGANWSAWTQGATESEITQLRDEINLRVQKGELLSQINLTAGNTLIQTGKLYLDSSSVVFSGRAFIPSAAISELDADKLTFYGNGSKASIGAGIAQYDQDKIKSTINLQYQGGFEIHSSNQLGSILTMHDDTVRLAVKSNGMANPNSPTDQYSGFYASTSYSLMNSYLKDGTTSGISIGSTDSGVNKDYRIHVYDGSNASNNLSKGISISTSSRFDVYAGNSQLFLGPDKAELRGNDHATVHGNDHTFIEGGNEQIYIHDGEVCIGMPGHESDKTSVHLRVFGWADFNGWMNVMGLSQTSLLSTKTRIEPLDTREALDKIMAANVETYQFKSDVAEGKTKRHASVIIDDVHDISQYYTPEEFISENRKGRDDGDIVGYLMGAVQELKKQLDEMKKEVQING